ncbi:MAG: hypothetical protein OXG15_03635 [Gammaproteobacteria bacterium]|nr:hypothetical protein [Gammaproteobacteria bacterium]
MTPKDLSFNSLKGKAKGLVQKARIPAKDMALVVRNAVGDLDTESFKSWYESLDVKKRSRIDKVTDRLDQMIKDKARQRTDARIATAGRLPNELSPEQYEIIYREELDEIKNSLKLGVLQGALGVALASLGINLWI